MRIQHNNYDGTHLSVLVPYNAPDKEDYEETGQSGSSQRCSSFA